MAVRCSRSRASSRLRAVLSVVSEVETRLRTLVCSTHTTGLGLAAFPGPPSAGPSTTWMQQAGIQMTESWEESLTPLKSPGLATDSQGTLATANEH